MINRLVDYYDKPGGTVIEVGSRDGHDANQIAKDFNAGRVVIIDASFYCWEQIAEDYPAYEAYCVAVVGPNQPKQVDFWQVDPKFGPVLLGQSSTLYKDSYKDIAEGRRVSSMTMDDLVTTLGVDEIEVLKVDVEGATYDVIEGFSKIRMTRILHLETELKPFWKGQRLHEDVRRLMIDNGYIEAYSVPVWTDQMDTIWIRRD